MKNLILLAALLVPFTSFAAPGEHSVFGGQDARHDWGAGYSEIRYHGEKYMDIYGYTIGWTGYIGSNNTIGIEAFYPYKNWEFGWGMEYSDLAENVVETTGKYQLRIEYNINNWLSFGIVHKSNCRNLCTVLPLDFLPHGDKNKSNKGLNYVGFRAKIFKF